MTTVELLAHLSRVGVRLWADGDHLRFQAPKGALTPELRARLQERKSELLDFLRQVRTSAQVPAQAPLRRVSRTGPFPLSFAQERLWFIEQWEPGTATYNIYDGIRLEGTLVPRAAGQTLNEILRRHEILRTTFEVVAGIPQQRVVPSRELPMPMVDLQGLPGGDREREAQRLAQGEIRRSFHLSQGPLLRVFLFRLAPEEHLLLFNMHHIVSDGWSTGILVRELILLYQAFIRGAPSPLSELPIQYADFAHWQREWLQGERLAAELRFWREELEEAPSALELPADRPRPPVRSSQGRTHRFSLPPSLTEKAREVCPGEGVTLFMLLLAAWKALLCRYTGETDLVVGSPTANRNRTEVEGLIGFFVNTLALRTRLGDNPTFREVLARIRETTLRAQEHQDLPFEKLVDELRPARDLSRTPIFQVVFVLQNAPVPEMAVPGLTVRRLELPTHTAKFDLTLTFTEVGSHLLGEVEYSTDLFEAPTIARMKGHFQTLLQGALRDPGERLWDLPLLTPAEGHQIVVEWNPTSPSLESGLPVHALFELQVERTPEATAVVWEDERLTYGELNRRANRLAHHLRDREVGVETPVGVYLERSPEMVVAILGILKAGGAYVPMDPAYPPERLGFIVEDAGVRLVLTEDRLVASLPQDGVEILCLDQEEFIGWEEENPRTGVRSHHLIYVIYTSGSTGKPKGTLITHGNVERLFSASSHLFRFGSSDVWTLFHSYAFDFSVWEMWGALLYGGSLVVIPYWVSRSPETFHRLLVRGGVTVLNQTPSAFRQLVGVDETVQDARHLALRTVIFGGEALEFQSLKPWLERHPEGSPRLVNMYGITETTVHVTYRPVRATDLRRPSGSWIGRPLPDLQVYVLDPHFSPVPLGVVGEMYVGGKGVGRGYLRRPGLTAERFLPHPFAEHPGERLYRSGDLARLRGDGELEYLGRMDHQVKIRGFRIELGEIESALSRHPRIREGVVLPRSSFRGGGEQELVAYIVSRDEAPPPVSELRRFLHQTLPDYMVPTAFVHLPALPLTPNGKVNRRALPAPDTARPDLHAAFATPRTVTEEVLVDIWTQVLGVERVGIYDSFFDLGGHSLLATQLMSRVSDSFGVSLPIRRLFEFPTVAGLAEQIDAVLVTGEAVKIPPMVPAARDRELPLSYAQQNLWLFEQVNPGTPAYNTCRSGRVGGPLQVLAVEATYHEILRRHEALRTGFEARGGRPVQVIHPPGQEPLPMVDLQGLFPNHQDTEALRLSNAEARRPFHLAGASLTRAALLRLGSEDHVFILSIHHMVYDLWSGGLLLGEIEELYRAYTAGRPSLLPELTFQYADFALWQRQWLQGEILERQLAYWRRRLAGLSPVPMNLPTDRPRPPVETFRGTSQYPRLSAPLTDALKDLARREGVTLFMLLLAAFQTLLHRYTGQDDLVVGSAIANRNRVELEGIVGFFDNTIVLRTDASGNPSFRDFLGRVRDTALGAYAHQYLPFELLVEELLPERSSNRTPWVQVAFVYLLNYPGMEREMAGLKVVPYNLHSGAAKFDLFLGLRDSEEGLMGELEYNQDLLDDTTISRWIRHFRAVAEEIVARPDATLAQLSLLAPPERHQLLVEWAVGGGSEVPDLGVPQVFEAQVDRTPEAVAVVLEDRHLTYWELDERANRLAHELRRLGVGPEVRVGICCERSLEMVVALLGILKTGGVYVPLDPSYPQERLNFMLKDARVSVLLTQRRFLQSLADLAVPGIPLDGLEGRTSGEAAERPGRALSGDHLAYVMYTSGSTGRPKGTAIPHRGILRLVRDGGYLGDLSRETFLQFAPMSFDASTLEIWGPLLNGGRLAIFPPGLPSLEELGDFLQRYQVTTLWLTAGLFHQMVDGPLHRLNSVRQLLAGGDVLSPVHVRKVLTHLAGTRMINGYGPTENTTFTCCHSMTEVGEVGLSVSIGRPIPHTTVYVLDHHLQPVLLGVSGELYTGGDGLGRCYLARPSLTAERFVPHPWGESPGSRLYRTGDWVRHLPDGRLAFLGRMDQQVKIRGFRIELGEVEAALASHPAVREGVVVAREDSPGDRRLVAYVVFQEGEEMDPGELRESLRQLLPDYMVPSVIVALDSLPLTPNGKVDRRALPAPSLDPRESGAEASLPPADPVTEILSGIWAEVLGLEQVGLHDNFFELGGHSLQATQVISRIREAFGVELGLRVLFEGPTVAEMAATVEFARVARAVTAASPFRSTPRDGMLRLSFAQQRLWFLDQLEPRNPAYNIPGPVRLQGALQARGLEQVVSEIVRRHEVLRTTLVSEAGRPLQVIASPSPFILPVVDLQGLTPEAREREALRLVAQEGERGFDLAQGPLLRVALVRLDREDHLVLMTMHHIVSDGWSMGILVRELAALYDAWIRGKPSPLPDLPIQYADFANWQREWLSGDVLESELAYWKGRLAGAPHSLELPTDRPRPAVQTYRGDSLNIQFPKALYPFLTALARRQSATLFMTLLASIQFLLGQVSRQRDVVVGTPVANRNRKEIEDLIGFFVNTLVLRTDLSGDLSFSQLLRRVREVALEAYAHQDLPFERLVEELGPTRDLSQSPLFQVMFVLQNAPGATLEFSGLRATSLAVRGETAKFDLSFSMEETAQGIQGSITYNRDLFDRTTVQRLATRWIHLLEQIVHFPEVPLSHLSILLPWERQQLLVEWNDTRTELPTAISLLELIRQQVAERPEALAATFNGEGLTYLELYRRANSLAHHLRALGVGPEVAVGVFMERSLEMIIALFAVLKTGGAYLPLDPDYPAERLAFMLADAQAGLLLTVSTLADHLPFHGPVVVLDREWDRVMERSAEDPAVSLAPENAIYILFTSGSTGRPKGTTVSHRSAMNYLRWVQSAYALGPEDRVLFKTSLGFDVSFRELFWPLTNGATTVVARPGGQRDPVYLRRLIAQEEVTFASFPPMALAALLEESDLAWATSLRGVISGGEALPVKVWNRFYRSLGRAGGPRLSNHYGPTETTVNATYWSSRGETQAPQVPIGRPVVNTQVYVLDGLGDCMPLGAVGELWVGGVGVARGYLNRAGLTAERFVPDPFGSYGARLYRTGDLVRFRADGALEFLGRMDYQVKVRGYRVELQEIERVLADHPAVARCAVQAWEVLADDRRLVAYVVPARDLAPLQADLRSHLRQKLPEYMVPSAFLFLEDLPLLPSGKVNRRALPPPERLSMPPGVGKEAPRDLTELQLVNLWQELLGVDAVGIRDNFFDLGGHSLLAVRLLAKVREQFGRQLPLTTLFQAATVADLAAVLREGLGPPVRQVLVPIQPRGSSPPLFWVHPVGGNVLCYVPLARHLGPHQPLFAFQLPDPTEIPLPTVEEMAAHYVEEMRRVRPRGPYFLGGWSMGGVVAVEMARQLVALGDEVALVTLVDTAYPAEGRRVPNLEAEEELVVSFAQDLQGLLGTSLAVSAEELRGTSVDEALRRLLEVGREAGLVPAQMDQSEVRFLLALYQANLAALARYEPKPYPGRLTLFRTATWAGEDQGDGTAGWEQVATQGLEVYELPGDHYSILRDPHVEVLAARLNGCLERCAMPQRRGDGGSLSEDTLALR